MMQKSRGIVAEIQSTPLVCGEPIQCFDAVRCHEVLGPLDHIPVSEDRRIIGVASDPQHAGMTLQECMKPLTEDIVVSANSDILDLIYADWERSEFFLVLDGPKFSGLITKADLNKMPVRVAIFERIALFEELLTEALQACLGNDESWLKDLDQKQAEKLEKTHIRQKENGLDISLIYHAPLGTKVDVAWNKLAILRVHQRQQLAEVTRLRNTISHAKPLVTKIQNVKALKATLEIVEALILLLSCHLSQSSTVT